MVDSSLIAMESLKLVENVMNSGDLDKYRRVLRLSCGVCWVCGL